MKDQDSLSLWIPNLLVFMLVGWGIVTKPTPNESSRPKISSEQQIRTLRDRHHDDELVDARLWQDPLSAVSKASDESADNENEAEVASLQQVLRSWTKQTSGNTRVIAVILPGGSYSEEVERRLRTRYAIISGLMQSGYKPENGSRIGVATVEPPSGKVTSRFESLAAFENFVAYSPVQTDRRQLLFEELLVVYFNENVLGKRPISDLLRLLNFGENSTITSPPRIIGPASSDMLPHVIADLMELQKSPKGIELNQFLSSKTPVPPIVKENEMKAIEIFSPFATMAPEILKKLTADFAKSHHPHYRPLDQSKIEFEFDRAKATLDPGTFQFGNFMLYRTSGNDQFLCDSLARELSRRGVNLATGTIGKVDDPIALSDLVVLVSEMDTVYGRTLPLTFADSLWDHVEAESATCRHRGLLSFLAFPSPVENLIPLERHSQLHEQLVPRYGYLRGLDGEVPFSKTPKASDPLHDQSLKPEGSSREDYILRLAESIKQLEVAQAPRKVRAIGILGSDVYDKLQLLKGLRAQFPGTLFFTTDLDAELLGPKEYAHSKNLIIASNWDLSLPGLQRPIPPFREAYQSATYFSTLQATGFFNRRKHVDADTAQLNFETSPPSLDCSIPIAAASQYLPTGENVGLYEIGRNKLMNLDTPDSSGTSDFGIPAKLLLLGVLVPLTFIMILPIIRSILRSISTTADADRAQVIYLAALILSVAGFIFVVNRSISYSLMSGEEPFELWNGTSIWPSTLIRSGVIVLSIFYLWKAWNSQNQNAVEIKKRYNFLFTDFDVHSVRDVPILELVRRVFWSLDPRRESVPVKAVGPQSPFQRWFSPIRPMKPIHEPTSAGLWERYRNRGRLRFQASRTLILLLGYAAFVILVHQVFGEINHPVRGEKSRILAILVHYVSFFALNVLLFYIIDLCLECFGMMRWFLTSYRNLRQDYHQFFYKDNGLDNRWIYQGLKMIADRTETIGALVYYPFVLLFLQITSRNSIFDSFDWPVSIVLVYAVSFLMLLGVTMLMQRTASRCRACASDIIDRSYMISLRRAGTPVGEIDETDGTPRQASLDRDTIEQLKIMHASTAGLAEGSFGSLTMNPLFRAILIPLGGTGIFQILEFIS